jgi:hypothetical protein
MISTKIEKISENNPKTDENLKKCTAICKKNDAHFSASLREAKQSRKMCTKIILKNFLFFSFVKNFLLFCCF